LYKPGDNAARREHLFLPASTSRGWNFLQGGNMLHPESDLPLAAKLIQVAKDWGQVFEAWAGLAVFAFLFVELILKLCRLLDW